MKLLTPKYSAWTKVSSFLVALTFLFAFQTNSIAQAEICGNGIDDDGDGWIDINDPDCSGAIPFACDGKLYQTFNPSSDFLFLEVNVAPVSFTTLSNLTADGMPTQINSIGYNPQDNFIYGINPFAPYELYRLDSAGDFYLLGTVSGLAGTNVSGAIDVNGNLYVSGTTQQLYLVDLTSLTATSMGSLPDRFGDFAISPVNGQLYGIGLTSPFPLYSVDPSNASTTMIGTGTGLNSVGATYFNAQGELISYRNNPGGLNKLDLITGVPTLLGNGPAVSANDGCACSFGVEMTKEASANPVQGGTVFSYTFTIFNQTGAALQNVEFEDVLTSGFLWNSEPQNASNLTIGSTSITGSNSAVFEINNVAVGTSSFTIDVMTPDVCTSPLTYSNQASLSDLPAGLGSSILSDDPSTAAITDPTVIDITGDVTPPTIICPEDIIAYSAADECGAEVTYQILASDNCGSVSVPCQNNSGNFYPVGVNVISCTAVDQAGNTDTCSFTITVLDTFPPTSVCQNITIPLDANGMASVTISDLDGGSFDNCSQFTELVGQLDYDCNDVNTTVTVVVLTTDDSGNTDTCHALVTIIDPLGNCCSGLNLTTDPVPTEGSVNTCAISNGANIVLGIDGNTCVTLGVNASGGNSVYTYSWSAPSGVPAANFTGANTANPEFCADFQTDACVTYEFDVTVSDSQGCSETTTVIVHVVNASVYADGTICGTEKKPKVIVCHVPPGNPANAHSICISPNAIPAHIGLHGGDCLGDCNAQCITQVPANRMSNLDSNNPVKVSSMESKVYPNPFADNTIIEFTPSDDGQVTVEVFNLDGTRIATLMNGSVEAHQSYKLQFDGNGLSSGVYIYHISQSGRTHSGRMILMK